MGFYIIVKQKVIVVRAQVRIYNRNRNIKALTPSVAHGPPDGAFPAYYENLAPAPMLTSSIRTTRWNPIFRKSLVVQPVFCA